MKISKKSIFYTIYIIAITGIFLYFLFPSDTLKTYLAYRLSQGNPDVTITIDRVSPVIPPGISLYNVGIAASKQGTGRSREIKINARYFVAVQ